MSIDTAYIEHLWVMVKLFITSSQKIKNKQIEMRTKEMEKSLRD